MAKLHKKITKLVNDIYSDEYVSDISFLKKIQEESDLPYSSQISKIRYADPVKLRGFFTAKQTELDWLNYGKKQDEIISCLIAVDELKKKGLWNYDKNKANFNSGHDKIIIYNTEYKIETFVNTVMLDNKPIFVELKMNAMTYDIGKI